MQPDPDGYEVTRFNALRHGVLSRYTVLPWENEDEYRALLDALIAEHKPQGPTEEHLIEEITGILWRKRRLRLAEAATYRRGLETSSSSHHQTIKTALVHLDIGQPTTSDTMTQLSELDQDQNITLRALDLLQASKERSYDKALGTVSKEMRARWAELIKRRPFGLLNFGDEEPRYTEDANGLLRFLREVAMPRHEARRKELQNRPLIQEQAFGEALDADKLEGLARYEIHLDRKLERMLTMLIRLQDLRAQPDEKKIRLAKSDD